MSKQIKNALRQHHLTLLFSLFSFLFSLFPMAVSAQMPGTVLAAAPSPASVQNIAGFYSQTFSLDETIAALRTAGKTGAGPLEFRWDPFFGEGVFSLGGHYGVFSAATTAGESGILMIDNREIYTVPVPYQEGGELLFPGTFVAALKDTFTRYFEEDNARFRIAAIIIDPGHGGKDPGAIGNPVINGKTAQIVEKDIVLNVSKRLKTLLDRAYPDKQILMTRDRDVFPSLDERTSMANSVPLTENEAIIYISIHANYVFNQNVRGYEVWYLTPDYRRTVVDPTGRNDPAEVISILNDMMEEEFTTESIMMARSILRALKDTLGPSVPSRGLKAEKLFVVRNSRMPAVLVELGFVSNAVDAQLMTSETGLRKYTEALYKGITEFVGIFERSGGFTATP